MLTRAFQDPAASIELLTGDAWAPWMVRELNAARVSVLLAVYMISPHWRGPGWTTIDLVDTLAAVATRGVQGRLIVDQPNVPYTTHPFNTEAAARLQAAGWRVRVMPDARTLHEKVLLIDRALTVIGSHNISRASATSNYDTSIAIRSARLGEQVYRQFWQRWRLARALQV